MAGTPLLSGGGDDKTRHHRLEAKCCPSHLRNKFGNTAKGQRQTGLIYSLDMRGKGMIPYISVESGYIREGITP